MKGLVLALMLLVTAPLYAEDTPNVPHAQPPLTIPAAKEKHDRAIKDAQAAYMKAMITADLSYVADLDAAAKSAMHSKNAEEVVQIIAEKKKAELGLQYHQIEAKGTTFNVLASKDWEPSMSVKAGDTLKIAATGRWVVSPSHRSYSTCGPDGKVNPENGREMYYLEGKIGLDGEPFKIGTSFQLAPSTDGMLYLRANDSVHGPGEGSARVVISADP